MRNATLLTLILLLGPMASYADSFSIFDPITNSTLTGQIDSSGNASVYDPTFGVSLRGHANYSMGTVSVFDPILGTNLTGKVVSSSGSGATDPSSLAVIVDACTQYVPRANDCTTEADYQLKVTETNLYGITPGSTSLDQCKQQINAYQAMQAKYNQCVIDQYGYDPMTHKWQPTKAQQDSFAAEKSATDAQAAAQATTTTPDARRASTISQPPSCPPDSFASLSASGAWSCMTWNDHCHKQVGPNSYGDANYCHRCLPGYQVNSENNACIPASTIGTTTVLTHTMQSSQMYGKAITTIPFTRNLRKGMRGSDVMELQLILKGLGYLSSTTPATNYFGPMTQKAVIAFQSKNNISPALGLVGTLTQQKLLQLNN